MYYIKTEKDKDTEDYDYEVSSVEELDSIIENFYKPILSDYYKIKVKIKNLYDAKHIIVNSNNYYHLSLELYMSENMYRQLCLVFPNKKLRNEISILDYLKEGITKRSLLIDTKCVYLLYNSISKSYEEVDIALNILYENFGSYNMIKEKDLSKLFVINKIVYPRTVLIEYINLGRYRKSKLERCLKDISNDIVIASIIKNLKSLRKQKLEYLNTGIGSNFIKSLNTRNLNLLYYIFVVKKPYNLNDVVLLFNIYERNDINDLLL